MENPARNSIKIEAIRQDMNRVIDEWARLHFRLSVVLVTIACLVEILLAFFIIHSSIITTTIWRYIWKFILFPTGISIASLLICQLTLRSKNITRSGKAYAVSFLIVILCFVYYTVHSAFLAIFALYAFAIFLTTTYTDYRLTGVVAVASVMTMTVSELLIRWDFDKVSALEDSARMVNFLVAIAILLGCAIVASVVIQYERKKNELSLRREVERELLKESLQHDELSGALNRKALHEALLALELNELDQPLVFVIADVDHFKNLNDQYGHSIGDLFLVEFSCILTESFGEDAVYRYGGDEFCMILRNLSLEDTVHRCQRVQARFRRVEFEEARGLNVTVSFGVTAFAPANDISQLFHQADQALYEAKKTLNAIRVYCEQDAQQAK